MLVNMKQKEFHSPLLKRTVKPDETDYLKHYEAAIIFELNFMNKHDCYCMGCNDKRQRIERELKEIFNLKNDEKIQPKLTP